MNRIVRTTFALTVLVIAVSACLPEPTPVQEGKGGVFYTECALDHSANDDPIVFPGDPGASHLHDFFGGVGIDADTVAEDLVGGSTTCLDQGDTAGYWTPSLEIDGVKIDPYKVNIRYSAGGKQTIAPFPTGLLVVAGKDKYAEWGCKGPNAPSTPGRDYTHCGSADTTAKVQFPDCLAVDENLDAVLTDPDGPDGPLSHMAYSSKVNGVFQCPSSHPYPVPSIIVKVHYGQNLPEGVPTLGNMGMSTLDFHADFMSAWVPERLAALVQYCLVERHNCGESSTGEPS